MLQRDRVIENVLVLVGDVRSQFAPDFIGKDEVFVDREILTPKLVGNLMGQPSLIYGKSRALATAVGEDPIPVSGIRHTAISPPASFRWGAFLFVPEGDVSL